MGRVASLLDLVLPPACAACGSSGALLCDRCLRAMPPPARASDAFVAPDAGVVIGETVTLAISALAYEGPVRRALGRLKYAGAARVAGPLATAALPAFDRLLAISGPASLVPVPVHLERRRTRGYNQAALIAEALTRARRLPMIDVLERRHATERQHRLDRAARLTEPAGCDRGAARNRSPADGDRGRRHRHHVGDARRVRIGPPRGRCRRGLRVRGCPRGIGRC